MNGRNASTLKHSSAFTLIEVLLALSITAIVLTTVSMVLHTGASTWAMATELADEGHDGDAILEQITMALRSAYYPANGEPSYDYGFQIEDDGEAENAHDVISWVKIGSSLIGEDTPWAGTAHRVKLFVNDSSDYDGPGLYVSAWQIVGQDEEFDPDEDVEPILLSDQVTALDCRMHDPEKSIEIGEPYEWIDEWEPSNRIPVHVLLSVTMKPMRKGKDPDTLTAMVPIPMSAVSWNPAKVGEDNSRRNRRGNRGNWNGGRGGSGNGPGPITGGGFSGNFRGGSSSGSFGGGATRRPFGGSSGGSSQSSSGDSSGRRPFGGSSNDNRSGSGSNRGRGNSSHGEFRIGGSSMNGGR